MVNVMQDTPLVMEEIQRKPGIELGVVQAPALELAVLVVLDQVVIGVAGKRQRIEPQRIDRRQLQQPKIGLRRCQMRKIKSNQVMTEQKGRALGESVQLGQRRRQVAASKYQAPAGIRAQRGESADAAVPDTDFEVQREAARSKAFRFVRHLWGPSPNPAFDSPVSRRTPTERVVMFLANGHPP